MHITFVCAARSWTTFEESLVNIRWLVWEHMNLTRPHIEVSMSKTVMEIRVLRVSRVVVDPAHQSLGDLTCFHVAFNPLNRQIKRDIAWIQEIFWQLIQRILNYSLKGKYYLRLVQGFVDQSSAQGHHGYEAHPLIRSSPFARSSAAHFFDWNSNLLVFDFNYVHWSIGPWHLWYQLHFLLPPRQQAIQPCGL